MTATLPAFARAGSRIDVSVSALGDAKDLAGGTLLVTPLLAADGEVYGVAQGALSTSAIAARGAAASVTRNIPTSAEIANGATVEREVGYQLGAKAALRLGLRNPDLTTARRMADAINGALGGPAARATDPRTVALNLAGRDVIEALARIENLRVEPDSPAVVVIDEASGTIVMGANVRVSTVAIAQGNLTIRVSETPEVSQPGPLSNGQTAVVPRTNVSVDDSERQAARDPQGERDPARPRRQPQCARRRPAGHDQHPADDQGGRRAAGGVAGAMMGTVPATGAAPSAAQLADPKTAKVWKAAQDFEAMALGQFLAPMFDTVDASKSVTGGGDGENAWKPMLTQEMAKSVARHGGLGLAMPVFNQMLRMQEARTAPGQETTP